LVARSSCNIRGECRVGGTGTGASSWPAIQVELFILPPTPGFTASVII